MKCIALLLVGLFMLSANPMQAQSSASKRYDKQIKKANRAYEFFAYTEAATLYEQALKETPSDTELIRQLARCYQRLNDPAQTVYWYAQLADSLSAFSTADKLHYAQALASERQYDEARQWYSVYGKSGANRQWVKNQQAAFSQFDTFFQDSAFYTTEPIALNTEHSDFGPAYLGSGIVYASSREGSSSGKHYGWYDQAFLDLYYAPLDAQGRPGAPQRLTDAVNTRFHEGPAAFYADGQRAIFTRNNYYGRKKGRSEDYTMKLKLYTAVREDTVMTTWTNVLPFRYNSEEYSSGHPTVSADGSRLYYVSDRPGGQGGTDIYVCKWQRNAWGRPTNLGDQINTPGDEMFPFIHPSGVLYFASNGHGGLGGLDIYRVDLRSEEQNVHNVGYPINSSRDDFGFIADSTETTGFFSTNRNAQAGDDNIYRFHYHPTESVAVRGIVLSAQDSAPIASAQVLLQYPAGDTLTAVPTNPDGTFRLELDWEQDYRIVAHHEHYSSDEVSFSTHRGKSRSDSVVLYLVPPSADNNVGNDRDRLAGKGSTQRWLPSVLPALMVRGTVSNRETNRLLPGTTVTLENLGTEEVWQFTTDSTAQYRFALEPNQSYVVRAEREKYIGTRVPFSTGEASGILAHDLLMDSIEVGRVVRIDRIFYDFDKWNIREDAIPELEHLLGALRSHPSMKIELSSHTDVRGSDGYNQYLSSQRAQIVVAYLIAQGIRPDRMVAKGYGETKLVNDCENDVPCSEVRHQENRRTEFTITAY